MIYVPICNQLFREKEISAQLEMCQVQAQNSDVQMPLMPFRHFAAIGCKLFSTFEYLTDSLPILGYILVTF